MQLKFTLVDVRVQTAGCFVYAYDSEFAPIKIHVKDWKPRLLYEITEQTAKEWISNEKKFNNRFNQTLQSCIKSSSERISQCTSSKPVERYALRYYSMTPQGGRAKRWFVPVLCDYDAFFRLTRKFDKIRKSSFPLIEIVGESSHGDENNAKALDCLAHKFLRDVDIAPCQWTNADVDFVSPGEYRASAKQMKDAVSSENAPCLARRMAWDIESIAPFRSVSSEHDCQFFIDAEQVTALHIAKCLQNSSLKAFKILNPAASVLIIPKNCCFCASPWAIETNRGHYSECCFEIHPKKVSSSYVLASGELYVHVEYFKTSKCPSVDIGNVSYHQPGAPSCHENFQNAQSGTVEQGSLALQHGQWKSLDFRFPSPGEPLDEIVCIGAYEYSGNKAPRGVMFAQRRDVDWQESADYDVIRCDGELELVQAYLDRVRTLQPLMTVGWYTHSFDTRFIFDRCKYLLHQSCMSEFEFNRRWRALGASYTSKRVQSSARGEQTYDVVEQPGIFDVDLYTWAVQQKYSIPNFKLNTVANYLLNESKDDMTYAELHRDWRLCSRQRKRICDYCMQDAALVARLEQKMDAASANWVSSAVMGVLFRLQALNNGGQTRKVKQMMSRICELEKNWVMDEVTAADVDEAVSTNLKGAWVIDPIDGLYGMWDGDKKQYDVSQGVMVCDFASLYPSIMQAEHMCFSSMLHWPTGVADWRAHFRYKLSSQASPDTLAPAYEGWDTDEIIVAVVYVGDTQSQPSAEDASDTGMEELTQVLADRSRGIVDGFQALRLRRTHGKFAIAQYQQYDRYNRSYRWSDFCADAVQPIYLSSSCLTCLVGDRRFKYPLRAVLPPCYAKDYAQESPELAFKMFERGLILIRNSDTLIPMQLEIMKQRRKAVRRQIKDLKSSLDDNPDAEDVRLRISLLDLEQLSIKASTNSIYGFLKFAHSYPAVAIAEAITYTGRCMLATTSIFFAERGMRTIYGDTDSVFVQRLDSSSHIPTEQQALVAHVEGLCDQASELCFNRPHELEMESLLAPVGFFENTKKRYIARNRTTGNPYVKGMSIVRTDSFRFSKEVCRAVLMRIPFFFDVLDEGEFEQTGASPDELLRKYIRQKLGVLCSTSVDLALLQKSSKLKEEDSYSNPEAQAHVVLNRKLRQRKKGSEYNAGDTVYFLMMKATGSCSKSKSNLAEDIQYIRDNKLHSRVDKLYYLHQLWKDLSGDIKRNDFCQGKMLEFTYQNCVDAFREARDLCLKTKSLSACGVKRSTADVRSAPVSRSNKRQQRATAGLASLLKTSSK